MPLSKHSKSLSIDSEKERSRWPPLTKLLMSGEMTAEGPRTLVPKEKVDRWLVNGGYHQLFLAIFIVIHVMIFVFGFVNYQMKDNLYNARMTFGVTYAIARASALVLHFDVAMILLRKTSAPSPVSWLTVSCLPHPDLSCASDAPQRHHPIWYLLLCRPLFHI